MKRNVDEMHPVDQLRYFRDKVYISDEEEVQLKSTGNSSIFKTCFCQTASVQVTSVNQHLILTMFLMSFRRWRQRDASKTKINTL